MNRMSLIAALAAGLVAAAQLASAPIPDSRIHIKNHSSWEIHEIYVSAIDREDWGKNLLAGRVVDANGGGVEVYDIVCDTYDVRLVDENGESCIVRDINLCANEDSWSFDNQKLQACKEDSGS